MTLQKFNSLVLALVFTIIATFSSPAKAVLVYALTDENDLLVFDHTNPIDVTAAGPILGLGNQDLIGIDVRPSNGQIYGVGNLGGVFQINPLTFMATQVSTLTNSVTLLPQMLQGSRYGIDFNPTNNLLRIVSNSDQNLAVNVDTGIATVNTLLQYPGNTPNPSVSASAYSNNVAGAQTTTLYGIDFRSTGDRLVTQTPPASGTLGVVGAGILGVNGSNLAGFDIFTLNGSDVALAAIQESSGGISRLYSINLITGAATLIDDIGGGDLLDGLTVANAVPEPGTIALGLLGALAIGFVGVRRRRA